jgi:hypothetical protein
VHPHFGFVSSEDPTYKRNAGGTPGNEGRTVQLWLARWRHGEHSSIDLEDFEK